LLKTSSCRALAGTFQFRLQAIASDIGLGHGLPSLHTLFTCPRRLLQVTAGVFVGGCANQMHIEQVFTPDRKETHWGKRKLVRS